MISFIIPAHNEEALLGRTLDVLFASARAAAQPFEVIVVDDASTDRTAEIAHAHGARTVAVQCHQIAAARNAGAREAKGEILVFVDADTLLPPETLKQALDSLQNGASGGGARVMFDNKPGFILRLFIHAFTFCYFTLCRWAAGCFIFVRRDAFEKIGGFDERYFVSEEIHLSRALKRLGRFVILDSSVITSGRKIHDGQMLRQMLKLVFKGRGALRRREGLDMWYKPHR